ncbi:MAG: hypothetical protein LUE11_10815 [Clostridia bacterium]|nr:hypothetical protein [Clostridia bacterium]
MKRVKYAGRVCFAGLSYLYAAVFVMFCRTPLYLLENAYNDRLFPADDVYYVQSFFSETMDTSMRIIKHPLLIVFGNLYTKLEKLVFGDISIQRYYEGII